MTESYDIELVQRAQSGDVEAVGELFSQVESVFHPFSGGHHNPDTMIEEKLTIERVYRALEAIDMAQREVVVLRFLMGSSLEEVCVALGKTTAAVKSLQHRGLKSLRVALRAS